MHPGTACGTPCFGGIRRPATSHVCAPFGVRSVICSVCIWSQAAAGLLMSALTGRVPLSAPEVAQRSLSSADMPHTCHQLDAPLQDLTRCVAGCRGPEEADAESVRTAVLLDELDFPGELAALRLHPQPSGSCCAALIVRNQCLPFIMARRESNGVTRYLVCLAQCLNPSGSFCACVTGLASSLQHQEQCWR